MSHVVKVLLRIAGGFLLAGLAGLLVYHILNARSLVRAGAGSRSDTRPCMGRGVL